MVIALFLFLWSAFNLASCSKLLVQQETTFYPEPSELLRMEATAGSYPDADMVYLLDEVVTEVSESGESLKTVHMVVKVLTEYGKSHGECEIGFNFRTETVTLLYARTIHPDGSVISLKKDAIKTITPHSRFPKYDDYKEMSFSMPGIGIGSIIDYKYVKKSTPDIDGEFNCHFFFQDSNPILVSRHKVIAPEAMEINFYLRNPLNGLNQAPVVSSGEGKRSYLWEYKNIPQIPDEERMPPSEDIAFQLYGTTMSSWDDFCGWWWSQAKEKSEADRAINEKVRELTGDLNGVNEKSVALFDYVKKDIRYVQISLGKSGLVPKSASEVYENKYGDCKDRSALLISMLRAAGIAAYYVLIPTRSTGNLIKDFPYPFQFNHCIVAIETDDGFQFFDPIATDSRHDDLPGMDQDRDVMVIKEGNPVFCKTPLGDAKANGTFSQKRILINPDGSAIINLSEQYVGSAETSVRSNLSETLPTDLRKSLEEFVYKNFQGARLVDYSYSDPLDLSSKLQTSLKCHANQYYGKAGDMIILPDLGDCGDCPAAGPVERKHPIVLRQDPLRGMRCALIFQEGLMSILCRTV